MKKTSKWFVIFLVLTLVLTAFAGCSPEDEPQIDPTVVEPPEVVQSVKDKAIAVVADSATQLNGEYADKFVALMDSNEGREWAGYEELKATLDNIRETTGSTYVYILVDTDPEDKFFEITVDGSPEPDPWMEPYDLEGQFTDAMNGTPTAALSAWYDDPDNAKDPTWSAFAPIYDTKGTIVAILGVDYPAPEITDYPEWNRDAPEWNKLHY